MQGRGAGSQLRFLDFSGPQDRPMVAVLTFCRGGPTSAPMSAFLLRPLDPNGKIRDIVLVVYVIWDLKGQK